MDKPMDLAKTLEGLSAAATQGFLTIPERNAHTDRTIAYVRNDQPGVFIACGGKLIERREADTAFLAALWNAFRTGQLIVAQAGDVEAVARAIAVCADKLNEEAPDTCGRLTFVINRSDQFAQAAIAAMPSLAAKEAEVRALVIAAREAWESNGQSGDDLDRALGPFSSRVPYDDEPEHVP